MNSTNTPLMDLSSAIAHYPRLELVLVLTILGWVAAHWLLRQRDPKD